MTFEPDHARSRQAVALSRRHMPTDHEISLARYTSRGTPEEARIPKDFGPRQALADFEETYRNIIDYIVRITYRIWEDRDVEYIRDTYADASRVYDDYGLQRGSAKIVDDTYHTTGAFSDIELIADEIVWAGDDEVGLPHVTPDNYPGHQRWAEPLRPSHGTKGRRPGVRQLRGARKRDLPRACALQHVEHA